jgi:hypothetical protein
VWARVVAAAGQLDALRDDPRHVAAVAVAEPLLECRQVLARLDRIRPDEVSDPDALRLYGWSPAAARAVATRARAFSCRCGLVMEQATSAAS